MICEYSLLRITYLLNIKLEFKWLMKLYKFNVINNYFKILNYVLNFTMRVLLELIDQQENHKI